MAPPPLVAAGVAVVGSFVSIYLIGTVHFVRSACGNVETFLPAHVVGQELALAQLTDAVCQHLSQPHPGKPLVLSVHGPPGVGKTYSHLWLARSLYNEAPSASLACPGRHCRGYRVVYGLDYLVSESSSRLAALASEVVGHLRAAPDALLVVEEYDKLDCAARGLWRQLLVHPERANLTSGSSRAIILLESNLGMAELEELLTEAGDRRKVTLEEAEALLRDVVFAQWRASGCESHADTLKLMSLIDAFLPYLPLEVAHMQRLVELGLEARAQALAGQRVALSWDADAAALLASKVTFAGRYPLDGAKVAETALTRHLGRHLRRAAAAPACTSSRHGCSIALSVAQQTLKLSIRNNTSPPPTVKQRQQRQLEALQRQHQQQHQQQSHAGAATAMHIEL